jgi:uncharacterized membrane protein
MMPRGAGWQAAVSAVSFGVGYMLGAFLGWLGGLVLTRLGREPSARFRRTAWIVLAVAGGVAIIVCLWLWRTWQNDQRDLLGMSHLSALSILTMAVMTLVVLAILVVLARLIWHALRWLDGLFARRLPPAAAHVITAGIFVLLAFVLSRDVVFDGAMDWLDHRWARFDTTTAAGVEQPTSPTVSGSPDSLVPWDTLGLYGRTFVAQATSEADLRAFHGPKKEVIEPVRAYVGLRSADTPEERAELAVRDLERAGGFERDVLAVVTSTGSGWVDPDGVRALELLHAGNTAIVSQQYSYLPSWVAFIVHRDRAREAGEALYEAVHRRWSELPEGSRPKLIVFGESLGSYGAEDPFIGDDASSSLANMASDASGMLFTGPTAGNTIWKQLTDARQAGSPVWRPVYDGGTSVQFANRPSDLEPPDEAWQQPRILYVHHPSDPVGNWSWASIWRKPAWMKDPLGYDITPHVSWFPFVSGLQEVSDLVAGFGAPSGYGHNYDVDFASAWAAVVPPDGWTVADTKRLQAAIPSEQI